VSALLEVEDLHVAFGDAHAVDGVSFSVERGETLAVVGESGSGKTVTALSVMGLLAAPGRISAGDVRLAGRSLVGLPDADYRALRGRDLAMVFQDPSSALNPVQRVGAQVAEAIAVHGGSATAEDVLTSVGFPPQRAREYPHQLSGGLRQRVMLAMALANSPSVLIADEPTTALDVTTQAQILELLAAQHDARAMVLVTHDLGVVAGLADRVVVMYAGRVVECGPVDEIFAAPRHPYTRALLAATPRLGSARGTLVPVPGSPPDPEARPSGCAFHPRCTFAIDRCRVEDPGLRTVGDGHGSACLRADELAP
jgi:oligopeptide/dipeptide ABC transporter ATP-binding protein